MADDAGPDIGVGSEQTQTEYGKSAAEIGH